MDFAFTSEGTATPPPPHHHPRHTRTASRHVCAAEASPHLCQVVCHGASHPCPVLCVSDVSQDPALSPVSCNVLPSVPAGHMATWDCLPALVAPPSLQGSETCGTT